MAHVTSVTVIGEDKSTVDCFYIIGFPHTSQIVCTLWKTDLRGAGRFSIRLRMHLPHFQPAPIGETPSHIL